MLEGHEVANSAYDSIRELVWPLRNHWEFVAEFLRHPEGYWAGAKALTNWRRFCHKTLAPYAANAFITMAMFQSYTLVRHYLHALQAQERIGSRPLVYEAISGACAGAVQAGLCVPLYNVKLCREDQLKASRSQKELLQSLRELYASKGWKGCYQNWRYVMAQEVVSLTSFFASYEWLKLRLEGHRALEETQSVLGSRDQWAEAKGTVHHLSLYTSLYYLCYEYISVSSTNACYHDMMTSRLQHAPLRFLGAPLAVLEPLRLRLRLRAGPRGHALREPLGLARGAASRPAGRAAPLRVPGHTPPEAAQDRLQRPQAQAAGGATGGPAAAGLRAHDAPGPKRGAHGLCCRGAVGM